MGIVWRGIVLGLVAGVVLPGCMRRPNEATVAPPPPPGSPLPPGWAWPFVDVNSLLSSVSPGIVRPVDRNALMASAGTSRCAPVEIAPAIWVQAGCDVSATHSLNASTAVPVRPKKEDSTQLPAAIDLRAEGLDGPVKFQQSAGVCWSFALSTVMENALRRAGRKEVVAPLHLISSDAWHDMFRNGGVHQATTLEPQWPYDPVKACKLEDEPDDSCVKAYHVRTNTWREDPVIVAEVDRANRTGVFRVSRIEKLAVPLRDDTEIAAILATGQSVFASIRYNAKAWGHQATKSSTLPEYSVEEGPHAVVFVGYRSTSTGRDFLIHNSWSAEWREGGYAWISGTGVRQHLDQAFTVEVVTADNQPLPVVKKPSGQKLPLPLPSLPLPWPFPGTPNPTPPTTGTGCGPGQVRDVLFGACVAPCVGGAPPVAGICAGTAPPVQPNPPAPQGKPSAGCSPGELPDLLYGRCAPQCSSGLPRVGGNCIP